MATQNFYGDAAFKKTVAVTGIISHADGTSANHGATKSQVDAAYSSARLRSNHTGTQAAATISDLSTVVDGRIDTKIATLVGGAPSTFDTLAEIATWIASDESGTATLVGRVTTAEADIAALEAAVGTGSGGVFKATIGDNTASSFTITHGLGTTDCAVEVFETGGTRQTVFPVVTRPSTTTVLIDFDGVVVATGSHRVIVRGS